MKTITLGRTGITTPQNAFGALPIQRVSTDYAVMLLRKAYEGGMTFFDTARAYTDSEEKIGVAFEGMRDKRIIDHRNNGLVIDADKVSEINIIDIALNDNHGNARSLTELKGQVVLLDFHQFGTDYSAERIMMLRELYNKYHSRGLQIYQVAIGTEEHYWKTQTAALPWICVRDADGKASNAYLAPAPQIPCDYLINRENIVVRGANEIGDLDKEIAQFL